MRCPSNWREIPLNATSGPRLYSLGGMCGFSDMLSVRSSSQIFLLHTTFGLVPLFRLKGNVMIVPMLCHDYMPNIWRSGSNVICVLSPIGSREDKHQLPPPQNTPPWIEWYFPPLFILFFNSLIFNRLNFVLGILVTFSTSSFLNGIFQQDSLWLSASHDDVTLLKRVFSLMKKIILLFNFGLKISPSINAFSDIIYCVSYNSKLGWLIFLLFMIIIVIVEIGKYESWFWLGFPIKSVTSLC